MIRVRKQIVWLLVAAVAASPPLSYAGQPGRKITTEKIDVSYITPGAVAAAVAHPRRVLAAPEWQMLPIEVLSAAGKQEFGIDPLDIAQVMALAEPPQQGPPDYGVVIRFTRPHQLRAIKLPPDLPLEEVELEGRPYRRAQNPLLPGFFMPDDRTLLVATDSFLKKMLANRRNPVAGPLSRLVASSDDSADVLAVAVVEPVRPLLSALLTAAPVPPPLEGVGRLPDLIESVRAELYLTGTNGAALQLVSPSEDAAKQLEALLNGMLDLGQQLALSQITSEIEGDDPVQQASAQYAQRITRQLTEMFRPKRDGRTLRISADTAGGVQVATIGVLAALLLPAVQRAREAARRVASTNNLKQIALAMHFYHETHHAFPARANFDGNGKPLLSWRVHLLPFLDQQALYEQFHLDEPWDSAHNMQLIDAMPEVYRNPSSTAPANHTSYLVPAGPGSLFEGRAGTSISQVKDGRSNTILAVEVDDDASVIWTKPDDLNYDPKAPLAGLGRAHPGGFNVAMADAKVQFIAASINPAVFLRMLTSNDGSAN